MMDAIPPVFLKQIDTIIWENVDLPVLMNPGTLIKLEAMLKIGGTLVLPMCIDAMPITMLGDRKGLVELSAGIHYLPLKAGMKAIPFLCYLDEGVSKAAAVEHYFREVFCPFFNKLGFERIEKVPHTDHWHTKPCSIGYIILTKTKEMGA